jgi:hypothetical protein
VGERVHAWRKRITVAWGSCRPIGEKKPRLKGEAEVNRSWSAATQNATAQRRRKSDYGFGAYCSRNPHSLHRWETMVICLADFKNPALASSTHWAFSMPPVK